MIRKRILITVAITLLGIIIGWAMEIMPDSVKDTIENAFGEKYSLFWWAITLFLVLLMIICTYLAIRSEDDSNGLAIPNPSNNLASNHQEKQDKSHVGNRIIQQFGDKSNYIERNEGDININ